MEALGFGDWRSGLGEMVGSGAVAVEVKEVVVGEEVAEVVGEEEEQEGSGHSVESVHIHPESPRTGLG